MSTAKKYSAQENAVLSHIKCMLLSNTLEDGIHESGNITYSLIMSESEMQAEVLSELPQEIIIEYSKDQKLIYEYTTVRTSTSNY